MFIDSARITVRAGRGGNGCVAFRREKFVPRGGPDGGDGGRGGSVILAVESGYNTLLHIQNQRIVRAAAGTNGRGSNKTGASAENVTIPVPPGTIVRDALSNEILGDLVEQGDRLVVATGGRGGRGNARFASSTNRAPRRAEEGTPGEERELELELKLMADLGLVGLPNAGKSTLLSRMSAARPKVADYPFTTLEPHLGVVAAPGDGLSTLVMADIPGLIEGAHGGAGLGIQFLRHVERCQGLVHLVDLVEERDLAERVSVIRGELQSYSAALAKRSWILVGTKVDAVADQQAAAAELESVAGDHGVVCCLISAVSGAGIDHLARLLFELVEQSEDNHEP